MTEPIDFLDITYSKSPLELQVGIAEFWPANEWDNAARIAYLESGWDAFAEKDTRDATHPCGVVIGNMLGEPVTAEWSIGWFQINACNLPFGWTPEHLFNTRHNCGTAHDLWTKRGWNPWYFSAKRLGLL